MGRALLVLETSNDKQLAVHWIGKAPIGTRVEFKASKRSLPQNDLMWALLTEVSQQLQHAGRKYDPTQWKSIFLHGFGREINFLPSLDNKTFLPIELSSSDLSKEEMTDFIEYILKEGTERGVVFHVTTDSHAGDDSNTVPEQPDPPSPDLANSDSAAPHSSPGEVAGSPSLPAKFDFTETELVNLKDFARKGFNETQADKDLPAKEAWLDTLQMDYLETMESDDGRKAFNTIKKSHGYVLHDGRPIDKAREYIAREILDCTAAELEGRGNG